MEKELEVIKEEEKNFVLKLKELKNFDNDELKKENNEIKIKEMCNMENDANGPQEEKKYLLEEWNKIKDEESKIRKQILVFAKQIDILFKKNPLNKLAKYDRFITLYINKIQILTSLLNKYSSIIYANNRKHQKYH